MRNAATYHKLKRDFAIAMNYFDLPKDVQKVAWTSATQRVQAAANCYAAIAASLKWKKP